MPSCILSALPLSTLPPPWILPGIASTEIDPGVIVVTGAGLLLNPPVHSGKEYDHDAYPLWLVIPGRTGLRTPRAYFSSLS
ncbi:hypothetical protein BT96DRAFT_1009423 [Gymnopus androsaceus JB14]|uniref:Uncharacterized protein n=1 Tax=Gymnopus androsaceus JB14 TaxID=1447944 RepID=A0A6A4GCV2_9AGAR|nr:hypothetical protein BT96DRAFT_1009423 [Gymnopus androsaceus JB14]